MPAVTANDYIEHLQKENLALKNGLADRDKLIEKLRQQNNQLAQSNYDVLRELNIGKEELKKIKHELDCKKCLLKAKELEMKKLLDEKESEEPADEVKQTHCLATKVSSKAVRNNDKIGPNKSSHSTRSFNSIGEVKVSDENKRTFVRRQSARFKSQEPISSEELINVEGSRVSTPACISSSDEVAEVDTLKGIQHEMGCKNGVLKEQEPEMKELSKEKECEEPMDEVKQTHSKAIKVSSKAVRNTDKIGPNKRQYKPKSFNSKGEVQVGDEIGNKRPCTRRQPGRYNDLEELQPVEDRLEMVDRETFQCQHNDVDELPQTHSTSACLSVEKDDNKGIDAPAQAIGNKRPIVRRQSAQSKSQEPMSSEGLINKHGGRVIMSETRSGRVKSLAGVKYTDEGGENPIEGDPDTIATDSRIPIATDDVIEDFIGTASDTIAIDSGIPIATEDVIGTTSDTIATDSGIPIATEDVIGTDSGIPTSSGAHPTPSSNILGIESGTLAGGASTSELPSSDETYYDKETGVKVDTKVLLGEDWTSHIGSALSKNPKARGLLDCKSHAASLKLWNHESECEPFKERLVGNPLVKLVNNSYRGVVNRLCVSAFLERWQPSTNTFHLPFGEMTITLEDVCCITGLPVKGKPLNYELGTGKDHSKWVHEMLGISRSVVVEELKLHGGSVSKSWLKNNLAGKAGVEIPEGEGSSSGGVAPVISVDQAVRGYLLYLLCCTLFSNQTGDKISIAYLHFLEDLDSFSDWAWGAATLAHLYNQFSKATRAKTVGVSGYISLLELWVYIRFEKLRPKNFPEKFNPATLCRKMEWKPSTVPHVFAIKLLVQLREELDLMAAQDVIWDAYKDFRSMVPEDDVCWYYGCIRNMDTVEAYHPNRVVRQFGHVQAVPQPPIPPKSSSRSDEVKKYTVTYESCDDDFIHYKNRLVYTVSRGEKSKFDWECDAEYMKWYCGVSIRHLSHVLKKKQRDSRKDDSDKARVLASLEDTMSNIKSKGKKGLDLKNLNVTLQMAWDFISFGVCTEPEPKTQPEIEPEVDEEESGQDRKKRARKTKKK